MSPLVDALGLSCRAYLERCAPEMYDTIWVKTARIAEFVQDISKPGSLISSSANTLYIRGRMPTWMTFPKVWKRLPNIRKVSILNVDSAHDLPTTFSPIPGISSSIMAQANAPSHLQELSLVGHMFASTVDLLRFLSSFPRLERLALNLVCVTKAPPICPPAKSTRLRYVQLAVCSRYLWWLMLCWKWAHTSDDLDVGAFPGFQHIDASIISYALQSINLGLAGMPPKAWYAVCI